MKKHFNAIGRQAASLGADVRRQLYIWDKNPQNCLPGWAIDAYLQGYWDQKNKRLDRNVA